MRRCGQRSRRLLKIRSRLAGVNKNTAIWQGGGKEGATKIRQVCAGKTLLPGSTPHPTMMVLNEQVIARAPQSASRPDLSDGLSEAKGLSYYSVMKRTTLLLSIR